MNRTAAAQRLWNGTGIVAGRLAKKAAGISWPIRIGAAVVAWKAGPALLDQAHQQPWLMPTIGAGWVWAAWRASTPRPSNSPAPPETTPPLTSTGSGSQALPESGGGEGFTIIDDPTNPARAIVIHKETAA